MPRAARMKDPEAIYHVMARSITEFDMFPDAEDKNYFLDLLKLCKEKYNCKVYAYSLMTNHYHILLDTNGYDISKFMKVLNQRYVRYINKKYKRKGHLLADRFNSKIITNTEYALTASVYIHNNAKDIPGYQNKAHEYPYSSMPIYINKSKDKRNLVDVEFILSCINENDKKMAIEAYVEMVIDNSKSVLNNKLNKYMNEFNKEQYQYKSYRKVLLRDKSPDKIVKLIAERYGLKNIKDEIMQRWKRSSMKVRAAVAYALTTYCGMGTKEVCEYMKNISGACLSKLCDRGFKLVTNDKVLLRMLTA